MKKKYRIKKSNEIDAIINTRKSFGNSFFVIYYKENNLNQPRFAISIGRKFGKAVLRNQIKRRIRYAIRQIENTQNYDYLVVVKRNASSLSYQEIEKNIKNLIQKTEMESKK